MESDGDDESPSKPHQMPTQVNPSTIESILDQKRTRLTKTREIKVEYLVKWKDFDETHNSWILSDNSIDPELIAEFRKRKRPVKIQKSDKMRMVSRPIKQKTKKIELDYDPSIDLARVAVKIPQTRQSKKHISDSDDSDDDWNDDQIEQLDSATSVGDPRDKDYWYRVAAYVQDKTALQCQRKVQKAFKSPAKKQKEKDMVFTGIQNVKGKLTKKRTIRKILEHADTLHKDDLFDSIAFKPQDTIADLEISFDESKYKPSRIFSPENLNKSIDTGHKVLKPVNLDDRDTYINKLKANKKTISQDKRKKNILDKNIFSDVGTKVSFNVKKPESDDSDVDHYFDE